ncbi:MAG: group III truncated hemoglobin [Salibacteraceae bacterium]
MHDSLSDITTLDDIRVMVDAFYRRVQEDELIGPIFNAAIQDRWPVHLEKMYGFWQTVLLNERAYTGSPFPPHAKLPIEKKHFDRWLLLFTTTVDQYFLGDKATEAKWRAEKMAQMFQIKIDYYKQQASPD